MLEEWKNVEGTNGKYKVSNFGNAIGPSGRVLKLTKMKIGYLSIAISYGDRKVIRHYVHKLVAEYFLGAVPDGWVVNHKDHNKLNNHVSNLEIVSRKENALHWAAQNLPKNGGKKRSGFCYRGHELIGGSVRCFECRRLRASGEEFAPPSDKIWKESTVPEYLVSKDGLVWSTKTKRILKAQINKPGYSFVSLRIGGETKAYSVHRLVVEAFAGEIPDGMVVDHINSKKTDNSFENLRVISKQSNSRFSRGRMRGDGINGFILNERQAAEIKWLSLNTKVAQREIATIYGVSPSVVCDIKNGHKWSHINPCRPENIDSLFENL